MVTDARATVIDMTLDGGFAPPLKQGPGFSRRFGSRLPRSFRVIAGVVLGGVVISSILMVWAAITLLPAFLAIVLGFWIARRVGLLPRRSFRQRFMQRG